MTDTQLESAATRITTLLLGDMRPARTAALRRSVVAILRDEFGDEPVLPRATDDKAIDGCGCRACRRARDERTPWGFPVETSMMIVCETCGYKRCPHATDHRHACTNSNSSGQRGSVWENVRPLKPQVYEFEEEPERLRGWRQLQAMSRNRDEL